jgi:hypothetical protein
MLLLPLLRLRDPRAGYGGALSMYFGLSAGLQQLHVSHISLGLMNNVFESCVVSVSVSGGNAYGGAVSIYMGAYASRLNFSGDADAAVGDTVVRNVSVTLDTARFASCSARREINGYGNGSNVYGGSFSFYIGAYAWSRSGASSSSSKCGATDVIGVDVRVQHATSNDSTAFMHVSLLPISSVAQSKGANSYGGAMSALFVGAYSWSFSNTDSSSSTCEATNASGVSVVVSDSGCSNCNAVSSSMGTSLGANSYGGAMSALFVGAYSWSFSNTDSSSSTCEATSVSGVSVAVSDSSCSNCSAVSSSVSLSLGANSYGGAMSALFVGAYSYSFSASSSNTDSSSSTCEATSVSGVSVVVSDSSCSNCSALSSSMVTSFGANSYGGAMSAFFVGAYSWSISSISYSSSACEATSVSGVSVVVSDSGCSNCSAVSSSLGDSFGANSYGGAMSALFVGAYSWSRSFNAYSSSACEATSVSGVSVVVSDSGCSYCSAVSSSLGDSFGANSYGGAMSVLFVGAYSWSSSDAAVSSSTCEATNVIGLSVAVSDSGCSNCSAVSSSTRLSSGANSYGGAMSVLFVGAYSWSSSDAAVSSSTCEATNASEVSVRVSDSGCSTCSAVSRSLGKSFGANSYGGAMSALFVGAYSWSFSNTDSSSSTCEASNASGVSVRVSDSGCSTCSAVSSSLGDSFGANSYGGAMSALFVGAYSWSLSDAAVSSSTCEATNVIGLSVTVSDSCCSNCSAVSSSLKTSSGANSYGGAMSVLFVGAYSWSRSFVAGSNSTCEATNVIGLSVAVSDSGCSNCRAVSSATVLSSGANSYGGAMSVLFVGAYSWSFSLGAPQMSCSALVTKTRVYLLSITIKGSNFQNSMALSGGCYPFILNAKDLIQFEFQNLALSHKVESHTAPTWVHRLGRCLFACDTSSWWRVTLRRFTAAQSAPWSGLLFGRLWDMEVPPHHAAPSSATSAVFLSMACQYKTALHCPTSLVLSLRHHCSLVC